MREHLSAEEFPGEGMAEAWYSTIAVGARKWSNVVKRALKAAMLYNQVVTTTVIWEHKQILQIKRAFPSRLIGYPAEGAADPVPQMYFAQQNLQEKDRAHQPHDFAA